MSDGCTDTIASPYPPPKRMRLPTGVVRKLIVAETNDNIKRPRVIHYVKLHGAADSPCCVGEAAGSPVPGLTAADARGDFAGFTVWESRNGGSASGLAESPSVDLAVVTLVPSNSRACEAGQVPAVRRRLSVKTRPA